ncbi:FtsX-like permease family protein [uncultured Duncaniella sp.]|jgi:lipoprotein-releasing system permease protein|uniref:ABC transporter permease n=1 Tax=uncultured Duncaniella sp. TaxID=2768039 RepID=UPI000F46EFAE|nr:FtsX-like permease family protein [uncultured Duncaniella sp.]ROS86413.1 ABC transporter permease [Muribaculaceae bacterium Isolate-080 (Janvier)]
MSLAIFIANRLSLRSPSGKMQSGIVIAVSGIALSVVVMLISIAVMMGFKEEIRQKIMGFDAQLSISVYSPDDSKVPLVDINDVRPVLEMLPEKATTVLAIRQPVILKTPADFTGAIVKGISRDYDWEFIRQNLIEGEIPDFKADSTLYHVIISRNLARDLSVGLGEKIDAFFLGGDSYRTRRLKVAAIYDTHFSEYDDNYIFSTLPMLSALAGVGENLGTQIEIHGLGSDKEIAECAEQLSAGLLEKLYTGRTPTFYTVTDVHTSAALYFNWLALLDTNVIVILTLMSLLTCLTLVSSLYILILRRVNMIGILKALGAPDSLIRRSFVYLTMRILVAGLVIGNLIGVCVILVQDATGVIPLNPEAYYLDHVPMLLSVLALIVLNLSVIVVAALVLILPSAIITTIPPSKVIKYD